MVSSQLEPHIVEARRHARAAARVMTIAEGQPVFEAAEAYANSLTSARQREYWEEFRRAFDSEPKKIVKGAFSAKALDDYYKWLADQLRARGLKV